MDNQIDRSRHDGPTMKAVRVLARGGPEEIVYTDAPRPGIQAGDALVRVRASAITPAELTWPTTWSTKEGTDRLPSTLGHEFAGIVEGLAPDVDDVRIGDAVYALSDFWRDGSEAEYVAVHAADLAPKPTSLDDISAAAVPLAGLTAWQALFTHAGVTRGQRALIHGAAGGVGTYAVQLAKWAGAFVIGTASSENAGFLRRLGCDEVIDYKRVSFDTVVHDVDVVLDTVGGSTLERSWNVLRRGGTLVSIVEEPSPQEAAARDVRAKFFIVQPSRADLLALGALIDKGAVKPIVEGVLPLAAARFAYQWGLSGHARGKLILTVAD
jgi:NADPH:quinone reductase-like Zn-dependent oxidoreductase